MQYVEWWFRAPSTAVGWWHVATSLSGRGWKSLRAGLKNLNRTISGVSA